MKHLAWSTGVVLATFTAAILVVELRNTVMLFVLSLVIAATVRPLVDWFVERRLPRTLALLFTYFVCVGFIIALVIILSGPLLTEFQQLTTDVISSTPMSD